MQEGTQETEEDTRGTREAGTRAVKVTKDIKEEVKEDMEDRRDIKEEVKEGIKDGTHQQLTRDPKEEVKEDSCLTASAAATNAEVKGTSP